MVSLELVKPLQADRPEFRPEAVHPLLAGSAAVVESGLLPDGETREYRVSFTAALGAEALAGALAEPIEPYLLRRYDSRDVRTGLKSFLYPGTREMRHVACLAPDAPGNLLRQGRQIRGLMATIDRSRYHQMVEVDSVRVLDPLLAELEARVSLTEMKPTQLRRFCETHGLSLDEIKMWRLKGGNRRNRPVSVEDFGVDGDGAAALYVADHYLRRPNVTDGRQLLIPVEDLPADPWVRMNTFIELLRHMRQQERDDQLGEVWDVLLRRDNTARHVVQPQVAWRVGPAEHRNTWIDRGKTTRELRYQHHRVTVTHLIEDEVHLAFPDTPPVYSPVSHTVVHSSSALGAALLAGSLPADAFGREMALLRQGDRYGYWDRTERPNRAAGYLIALLQSPVIEARTLGTRGFGELQRLADSVIG